MFTARQADAVTTSDSTIQKYKALYIGGAGNVAVLLQGDTVPVTFTAVPVGTVLWLQVQKVMATNTTATLIVGLN